MRGTSKELGVFLEKNKWLGGIELYMRRRKRVKGGGEKGERLEIEKSDKGGVQEEPIINPRGEGGESVRPGKKQEKLIGGGGLGMGQTEVRNKGEDVGGVENLPQRGGKKKGSCTPVIGESTGKAKTDLGL